MTAQLCRGLENSDDGRLKWDGPSIREGLGSGSRVRSVMKQRRGGCALLHHRPLLTAWFVTTSRTKLIPSGSGICTPRHIRSVGGSRWLSLGPPSSPRLSLSCLPTPSPTIEHGHHPNLQHGLQRGLQRDQLGGRRQDIRAASRKQPGLHCPAPTRPRHPRHPPTHGQRLQGGLV